MKFFRCLFCLFAVCPFAICLTPGCNQTAKTDPTSASQPETPIPDTPVTETPVTETPKPESTVTDPNGDTGRNQGGDPAIDRGQVPEDVVLPSNEQPPQFRMFSWNVESEGADADVIASQLSEFNLYDHYDVFALSEVMPTDLKKYRLALGKHYNYAYSKSGHNDRLELLYNEDKFKLVRHFEIREINISNRYRAPLVVHLKERKSDIEFMVMVNHLARGKAEIRQEQATRLVDWARKQTLPVFALGDYNYDYVFSTRKGNLAFVNMMRDNIWRWVEPTELIDTNWYDNPEAPDGKDDYPGSMLDFAFVAGPAKDWSSTCNIIVREGDFPDDETTSDHRPYELLISK